jgi:short-subunit dehydrogenase
MHVVITGATKGIGRAIAEKFAEAGNTIIGCARNEMDLYKMADELQTKYPSCLVKAKPVDMSDTNEVKQFGKWMLDKGLVPDILVNNAGSFIPGSVYNEEEGTLEKMIEVNLYSAYHLTRAVLPAMMEKKQGHIFNMCSIASLKAYANGGSYSISKFAMLGFSKNLREEMKPYGIKVTAIYPGATMTASWEGAGVDPKRIMEVNDVAEMVMASSRLSAMAVVEDIILRPQLGDL